MMARRTRAPLAVALLWTLSVAAGSVSAATGSGSTSSPESLPAEGQVVARVNGEALYVEDVSSVLEEIHRSAAVQDRTDFDLDQMLFRLVNDTLLAQEARALGMDRDEALERRKSSVTQEMAKARLENEEIRQRVRLEPEQLDRAYREAFRTATLRVLTRKDRAEAEALQGEFRSGADLESLAREKSQDPYARRGGLIDDIPLIDLPRPIAALAATMQPGESAEPVATALGWTLFRLEALQPADPQRFEQRRGQVRDIVRSQQVETLRSELLERLRGDHPVTLYEEVYDAIGIQTMPDGRLLPQIDDPEAVVVDVAGRPITAATLGQALAARWGNTSNPEVALAMKPILLDSLVVDELMVAEALKRGYGDTAEVRRALHAVEARWLVARYLREVIAPRVEVTREEMRAYFDEHRAEFRKPPRLYVSQLTVEAEAEAERLAEMVRSGTEFAWLARQHSKDRFREAGGRVGWVLASEGVRGFERELATAAGGDLFGPKGFATDWRLVRVDALEEQGHYDFEEVSGNVRSRLEEREFFELVDSYIHRLRERSEIWVDHDAIAALAIQASPAAGDGPAAAPGHGGE